MKEIMFFELMFFGSGRISDELYEVKVVLELWDFLGTSRINFSITFTILQKI